MSNEEIMILLFAVSAHLTMVSLFREWHPLKFLLLSLYLKSGNLWYEHYLETRNNRHASVKEITRTRKRSYDHMSEMDHVVSQHASITGDVALLCGSWIAYSAICAFAWMGVKFQTIALKDARNARIRQENLRA